MPSASIPILSVGKMIKVDVSCTLPGKTLHDKRWDRGEPDALIELPPSKRPKRTTSDTAGSSSDARMNGASYNARDGLRDSPSAAGITPTQPPDDGDEPGPASLPYHYYRVEERISASDHQYLTVVFWAQDTLFTIFLDDECPLKEVGPLVAKCRSLHTTHETPELFQLLHPLVVPLIEATVPPPRMGATPKDLQSHLRSTTKIWMLTGDEHGQPALFPHSEPPRMDGLPFLEYWPDWPDDLPRFELADVTYFRTFRAGRVYEVGIGGKTFLYKTDPTSDRLACESGRLSRIVRAGLSLRIPTVEGYLGIESEFPGLLMTFIPSITLQDLVDQEREAEETGGENNDNDNDPDHAKHADKLAERWKWFHQIRETVVALHKHGCHWGDVKPSNVVIDDANRDVWLIDFGAGWTAGFVSPELCDTAAGDLEGLAAIGVFLGLPVYPRTESQNETRCQ